MKRLRLLAAVLAGHAGEVLAHPAPALDIGASPLRVLLVVPSESSESSFSASSMRVWAASVSISPAGTASSTRIWTRFSETLKKPSEVA
ncbi:hypothetical protein [Rubrobacter marinus]|uniref:hypothetical protein n=1 Tax=Rubrobacter marinus TaxID=2653852 RepID=UPI001D180342|nr:hypothetical protein [Rubrobacter marinus]